MVLEFLIKLNAQLPFDLVISLLSIYPKEMKTICNDYKSLVRGGGGDEGTAMEQEGAFWG